ncbi:MAG TPA: hypothetical protein VKM54_25665 [Myxococcota bacterium]|nr:hypothetical protein [Myxococcota bacterium]
MARIAAARGLASKESPESREVTAREGSFSSLPPERRACLCEFFAGFSSAGSA